MIFVAWFELIVGVGIVGFWVFAVSSHQVPELDQGDRAIFFHIAAEIAIGLALIGGGLALLVAGDQPWVRVIGAAAAGGVTYSTINSPGYYAQKGNWPAVGAFGLLSVLGIACVGVLTLA